MLTNAIKEPGKAWEKREVEDTLKTYQDIVGGPIEHFHRSNNGVEYFCNEEGLLRDLEPNVVVCGQDHRRDNFRGQVERGRRI